MMMMMKENETSLHPRTMLKIGQRYENKTKIRGRAVVLFCAAYL